MSVRQVVILGAGRAVTGAVPSAVVGVDDGHRVLDWQLDAFKALGDCDVCFVAGYRADEVIERYPDVRVVLNREWERTGPAHSLGLAPIDEAHDVYVCYSDIVFRRAATVALDHVDGDLVVAVDTSWRGRYDGRARRDLDTAEKVSVNDSRVVRVGAGLDTMHADAEFAGVVRMRGRVARAAGEAIRTAALPRTAGLPDLINHLIGQGVEAVAVDLHGQWAELDAKQDLARFVLGTKAESLERLRTMEHGAEIPPLVTFTLEAWHNRRDELIARALSELPGERLIVRSSALGEDGWLESHAGRHESVAGVHRSSEAVGRAVDDVFASYESSDGEHQVLVQPMLEDVSIAGVVMTRTHAAFAPYYVINFDDTTHRTDAVTSGQDARTIVVHRDAGLLTNAPAALSEVLQAVQNIEKLVGHDSLDIEFAVTSDDRVHILQVRPIATAHAPAAVDDEQVGAAITRARRYLAQRDHGTFTLLGRRPHLSVMTDWNPAEIIGTKPRRLATSLYRHLVTDEVWARQRAEYGYRDVRPCPLLVEVAGHPYIDVRASLNSFVPAALDARTAARLVDAYLDRLHEHPELHDKIEFEVAFTCAIADFDAQAGRLAGAGLDAGEIAALRDALRDVTAAGIDRLAADAAAVAPLDAAIGRLRAAGLAPLDETYYQLELVRRAGTPVFAHLARGAFVATALIRSFERAGVLTEGDTAAFLVSVQTVLGRMRADAGAVASGALAWEQFVDAYGHLRPGTYDITSPSYRSAPDLYLGPLVERAREAVGVHRDHTQDAPVWNAATRRRVDAELARMGLGVDCEAFLAFAAAAIAGREESKFVFTKALSAALDCIAEFGAARGLTRDELALVSIADLLACRDVLTDEIGFLRERVSEGRAAFELMQGVCLPGQITSDRDVVCFEQRRAEPNFVTQSVVEARVATVGLGPAADVDGRIVLIPNADPGFDWLLARPIAGLVTMFGGANSHMAVRAAELRMPAAIGVGEVLYAELEPATVVRLDCASRRIGFIR